IGVGGANIVLPSDARVARVDVLEPKRILAEFDETVIRDIPITPTVVGIPGAKHVQVGKTFVNPSAARVKGPRRLVDQIALVPTDEINIQGNRSTVRKKVKLLKSFGPTVEITPEMVEIGITIEPILVETLQKVAVEITDDLPKEWTLEFRPESLWVKVSGARSFVETASKQPSKLALSSPKWSLGSTPLKLREIRGRKLIFSNETSSRSDSTSDISGVILLPHDVEILEVQPKELVVAIQRSRAG
ncbi:MAG TPA: YbbR-like domain-containing protein, partial [bacterium]|nr:YbbR-like domain-containing protein [bacterium]